MKIILHTDVSRLGTGEKSKKRRYRDRHPIFPVLNRYYLAVTIRGCHSCGECVHVQKEYPEKIVPRDFPLKNAVLG